MNAPERLPLDRPAIDGAQYLPINLCEPASFNPRKRFDQAKLEELANSIEKLGVMQPVLARVKRDAKRGGTLYEIIAGERRLRACKLVAERRKEVDIAVIPAVVRDLTDFEARELATTENLQRSDLHPLEEAEGYEGLLLRPVTGGEFKPPRAYGYSVDELAKRIGKSRGYVFGRLKLLQLVKDAREAFYADKISASVALMLARMPAHVQEKALAPIVAGWGGEPFSARQASEYLHKNYMLALKSAVFDIADANLVAKAGSCHTCPKRSGSAPELFDDVKSADVCTDHQCFDSKVKAHGEQLVDKAREKGLQVVTGKAVSKIMPYGEYSLAQTGHLNLDKPAEELTGTRKTLRTLLGDDFKETIVIKGEHQDQPMLVAQQDAVRTALKAKGLLQQSTKSKPGKPGKALSADDIKKQRSKRVRDLMFKRAPSHLWKHLVASGADGLSSRALIRLIEILADQLYYELDLEQILAVAGLHKTGTGRLSDSEAVKLLAGQSDATLANIIFMCLMGDHLGNDSNEKGLQDFAADLEWPVQTLVDEISDEVDCAIADEIDALKKAIKPAAKKAPAAAKTTTPSPKKGSAKPGEGGQQQTPETALAAALAKEQASAPKGAKKTTKSTSQKDKAAAPQVTPVGAWPFPTGPKPATPPAAEADFRVGDAVRVKADAPRAKTRGRTGTVDRISDSSLTLRWGPRAHEIGVYPFDQVEHVLDAKAAWPLPTGAAA